MFRLLQAVSKPGWTESWTCSALALLSCLALHSALARATGFETVMAVFGAGGMFLVEKRNGRLEMHY